MTIKNFSHVNVRTSRLGEMIAWYGDVLGVRPGWRPDFGFGGAWLYVGDAPVIHLVEVDAEPNDGDPKIEHFAFDAHGMNEFQSKLEAKGVPYRTAKVPGTKITQFNIHDPDGNHIHVDFDGEG